MRRCPAAFTLVEVLAVIAIIALLIAALLPALGRSRAAAQRVVCLANMRTLEVAHLLYADDHNVRMLGTAHEGSWIEALRAYDEALLLRSPVDRSEHFPDGTPYEGRYRRTSYAINHNLSPDNRSGVAFLYQLHFPASTAHFVIAAFAGPGSVSDHVHPAFWHFPNPARIPVRAATEMETGAHGGITGTWNATGNYGFADGHAQPATFAAVYATRDDNCFDPAVARRVPN